MSYRIYNNYQNYIPQAVAIGYDHVKDIAPKVIASGKGIVAEQIIKKAKEKNIPIHKDEDLVKILSIIELDSLIPMQAYSAVAEILFTLYKYNNKLKEKVSK
jgi:flagellar biosynthesis protein